MTPDQHAYLGAWDQLTAALKTVEALGGNAGLVKQLREAEAALLRLIFSQA